MTSVARAHVSVAEFHTLWSDTAAKPCAEPRPSTVRDHGGTLLAHTQSEVVLLIRGAVDGVAHRLRDGLMIVIQPALGMLALKLAPGRHGEPLDDRVGIFGTVIKPPTMATRSQA